MSRVWRLRCLMVLLTVFFVCFGRGRPSHWRYLVSDDQGHRYYLDERRLERTEIGYRFYLRCDSRLARYELDLERGTVARLGEPPQALAPNSVAAAVRSRLLELERAR